MATTCFLREGKDEVQPNTTSTTSNRRGFGLGGALSGGAQKYSRSP